MKQIYLIGIGVAAAYAFYRMSKDKSPIPDSFAEIKADLESMAKPFLSSEEINAQGQTTVNYEPPKTLGAAIAGGITSAANDTAKIITATGNAVQTVGGAAYDVASSISSGVAKASQSIATTLGQVYQTTVQPVASTISSSAQYAYQQAQAAAQAAAQRAQQMATQASQAATSAYNTLKTGVSNTLGSVYSWITRR